MYNYKISSFFIRRWFFPQKKRLLCTYCQKKSKKTCFLNEISSKNFNFKNEPRFNWFVSTTFTIKKITQPIALVLKYYMQNFKLFNMYYFVTNIFHMFKFFNVCCIKLIKSTVNKQNNLKFDIHMLPKKMLHKYYTCDFNFLRFNVLLPYY